MTVEHEDLSTIASRTGQTPAEIIATWKMEGEHFPNVSEKTITRDEVDELLNMLEDFIIQQEALIKALNDKGIITQNDVDKAVEEIIAEDTKRLQ